MADETTTTATDAMQEGIDVHEAVRLMEGLDGGEDGSEDGSETRPQAVPKPGDEVDRSADSGGAEAGEEGEDQGDGAVDAPEFWSAEDKALWAQVPAELRPVLKRYEDQRIAFANEKAQKAAADIAAAEQRADKARERVDQAAAWWQQASPALLQAFANKWQRTDWAKLAAENPAEWTRLRQEMESEATLLAEADRRGQADIQAARQRAQERLAEARQAEHGKLASRFPDYFGADKAARTYQALGSYLLGKGLDPGRINAIHEAPIIEIALNAMRFEQAQKQASAARSAAARTPGNATPTRVAPGPASQPGNRQREAVRQVSERVRKQPGGASVADAAALIRMNGL
jgi:hypothetical protein